MKKTIGKITPYLYLLPAFIIMAAVIFYPIINMVIQSFFTSRGGELVFAGLHNYQLALDDSLLWIAISNNLKLFLCVPIMTFLSLVIAMLLFNRVAGWQFYRSIIFLPYIMAITVVGIVFTYLLQYRGVINTMLKAAGLDALALDWLGDPNLALPSVAGVIIWKQLGFGVVLFLARMMSIDASLYEAASVDGATRMQQFWHITLPQTRSIIEFHVTVSLIEMLSWVFNYIYVMTAGGPGNRTMVLEYLIYKKSFGGGDYNIAMAISVILLVLASVLVVAQRYFLSRGGEE